MSRIYRGLAVAAVFVAAGCRAPATAPAPPPPSEPAPTKVEAEPAPPPEVDARLETIGELAMHVPLEWERVEPSSPMRVAEFRLPGPGGDVDLSVFSFPGDAGSVEANLERWRGQFEGEATAPRQFEVESLVVTRMDVTGTYVAPLKPGAPEKHDEPDSYMMAAIVEGGQRTYYFKCVGPAKAVRPWVESFDAALATVRLSQDTSAERVGGPTHGATEPPRRRTGGV